MTSTMSVPDTEFLALERICWRLDCLGWFGVILTDNALLYNLYLVIEVGHRDVTME